MNLKHVLGDIHADQGNRFVFDKPPYGTSMPRAGAVHSINCCREQMQQFGGSADIETIPGSSRDKEFPRRWVHLRNHMRCMITANKLELHRAVE